MQKIAKGNYGYLKSQRKIETVKSVALFALSAMIFVLGYLTTHTKANLLTIVAVVSVLPAAKQLTTTVLFYKYRSGSREMYEKIKKNATEVTSVYDVVITAYDKIGELLHVAILGKTIIGYSEKEPIDERYFANYIKEVLEKNGYKGISVKIFRNGESYLERLQEMQKNLNGDRKIGQEQQIAEVIKAVSI